MRKFVTTFAAFVIGIIFLLKCTGNNHLFKALSATYLVGKTGPTIYDEDLFPYKTIVHGKYRPVTNKLNYNKYEVNEENIKAIESYEPVALLVLHNEDIMLERYWGDHNDATRSNSFSVAKSFVALTVLKAIEEGQIESLDQKVIDFIPELDGKYREEVTIRHLLQMTSGINFNESYGNPFGMMAAAYYGDDLENLALSYDADGEPGSEWKYLGGNTVLLAIIVERATGMPMSGYFQKWIWQPMGSTFDARWNMDREDGMVKAFCCFYASAREYARFGLLVNRNGTMLRQRIMEKESILELKKNVVLNNGDTVPHYGLHFWKIKHHGTDITFARGILGQYIICIPEWDMVVVRLGHNRGKKDERNYPEDLYLYLDLARDLREQLRMPF